MQQTSPHQDAKVTTLSPNDFAALLRLSPMPNPALARACATKAYFDAHKYDPNGGAKCAALVCTCPACTGRVSL